MNAIKHLVEEESAIDFMNDNPDPVDVLGQELTAGGFKEKDSPAGAAPGTAWSAEDRAWTATVPRSNATWTIEVIAGKGDKTASVNWRGKYKDGRDVHMQTVWPLNYVRIAISKGLTATDTKSWEAAKHVFTRQGYYLIYYRPAQTPAPP